jgi:hypothetical protein
MVLWDITVRSVSGFRLIPFVSKEYTASFFTADLHTGFSNIDCSGNCTSYTIPSLFGDYAQFCNYFSISGKLTVIPFSPFSVQSYKYAECAVQSIISHCCQNLTMPKCILLFYSPKWTHSLHFATTPCWAQKLSARRITADNRTLFLWLRVLQGNEFFLERKFWLQSACHYWLVSAWIWRNGLSYVTHTHTHTHIHTCVRAVWSINTEKNT